MNKNLYYTNFMKLIVIDFLGLTTKLVKDECFRTVHITLR